MFKSMFDKKIFFIKPDSGNCIEMYYKNADCKMCLEVCHTKAIKIGRPFTRVEIDPDKCNGCEQCVAVCSYGVFQRTVVSEKQFCDNFLEKSDSGVLNVRCSAAKVKGAVKNECIGGLHAGYILYWFGRGIKQLNIHMGDCGLCKHKTGFEVFIRQLEALEDISHYIGCIDIDVTMQDNLLSITNTHDIVPVRKSDNKHVEMNRRDFFKNVGINVAGNLVNTMNAFGQDVKTEKVNIDDNRKQSGRKAFINSILDSFSGHVKHPIRTKSCFPIIGEITIGDGCTNCLVCKKLCPTGSITSNGGDKPVYTASSCFGCGICIKVCDKNNIKQSDICMS